jgi:hypothetical protein
MILFPSGELISANLSAPSYESIAGSTLSKSVRFLCKKLVVQFAVAAVSDRRNLLNQKTAVRDRRYKESNCTTTCKKDLPAVSSGCYNHDEGWLSLRSNIGAARGSHCMKLHLIPGGAI